MAVLVWLKRTLRRHGMPAFEPQIWHGPPYLGPANQFDRVAASHKLPDYALTETLSENFAAIVRDHPAPPEPKE